MGSGTAGQVTTDFTGKGYEVTVTKPDGGKVEVHLDSSFAVMKGGPGDHGPGGRPGGPAPGTGQGPAGNSRPGSAGGSPPSGYGG